MDAEVRHKRSGEALHGLPAILSLPSTLLASDVSASRVFYTSGKRNPTLASAQHNAYLLPFINRELSRIQSLVEEGVCRRPFTYTLLENRRERQNPKRLGFSTRPRHEKSPDAGNPTSGLCGMYFRGYGKADRSCSTAARFSPVGRSFGWGCSYITEAVPPSCGLTGMLMAGVWGMVF